MYASTMVVFQVCYRAQCASQVWPYAKRTRTRGLFKRLTANVVRAQRHLARQGDSTSKSNPYQTMHRYPSSLEFFVLCDVTSAVAPPPSTIKYIRRKVTANSLASHSTWRVLAECLAGLGVVRSYSPPVRPARGFCAAGYSAQTSIVGHYSPFYPAKSPYDASAGSWSKVAEGRVIGKSSSAA